MHFPTKGAPWGSERRCRRPRHINPPHQRDGEPKKKLQNVQTPAKAKHQRGPAPPHPRPTHWARRSGRSPVGPSKAGTPHSHPEGTYKQGCVCYNMGIPSGHPGMPLQKARRTKQKGETNLGARSRKQKGERNPKPAGPESQAKGGNKPPGPEWQTQGGRQTRWPGVAFSRWGGCRARKKGPGGTLRQARQESWGGILF